MTLSYICLLNARHGAQRQLLQRRETCTLAAKISRLERSSTRDALRGEKHLRPALTTTAKRIACLYLQHYLCLSRTRYVCGGRRKEEGGGCRARLRHARARAGVGFALNRRLFHRPVLPPGLAFATWRGAYGGAVLTPAWHPSTTVASMPAPRRQRRLAIVAATFWRRRLEKKKTVRGGGPHAACVRAARNEGMHRSRPGRATRRFAQPPTSSSYACAPRLGGAEQTRARTYSTYHCTYFAWSALCHATLLYACAASGHLICYSLTVQTCYLS